MNQIINMTNRELAEALKEYSKSRKGEIAHLTYAASIRISVLEARVRELEGEDDLK